MFDVIGGGLWAAGKVDEKLTATKAEFAATRKTRQGSIANMSLGGGMSQALSNAIDKAIKSGMHFAITAGNENNGAFSCSPTSAEKAVIVGASTLGISRAY